MSTKEEIQNILDRNESIQLIGLSGIGKSHLLRDLDAVFIDASILFPINFISLLHNFAQSIGIKTNSENPVEIQNMINEKILGIKTIIVIDGFEKIINSEFTQFFNFLKRLRDINKPNLTYIFSISSLNPVTPEQNNILGDLYRIVQENIIYARPYSKEEFENNIKNDFRGYINDETDLNELYNLTGGIISLVKAILKDNKQLLDSQIFEMNKQIVTSSNTALNNNGLIDKNGQIISSLLREHNESKVNNLTVLENLLFKTLKDNLNKIVSKDIIGETVYPEVKNKNGISDASIDQLIHRLKKKLIGYEIENQHGVGFKLSKI